MAEVGPGGDPPEGRTQRFLALRDPSDRLDVGAGCRAKSAVTTAHFQKSSGAVMRRITRKRRQALRAWSSRLTAWCGAGACSILVTRNAPLAPPASGAKRRAQRAEGERSPRVSGAKRSEPRASGVPESAARSAARRGRAESPSQRREAPRAAGRRRAESPGRQSARRGCPRRGPRRPGSRSWAPGSARRSRGPPAGAPRP